MFFVASPSITAETAYKNKYTEQASQLKAELEKIEFDKYAEIDTPFGANFKKYEEFSEVLNELIKSKCDNHPGRKANFSFTHPSIIAVGILY